MKIYSCQQCSQTVLFENTRCERCGSSLGFLSELLELSTLKPINNGWQALMDTSSPAKVWRYCDNFQHGVCNWLVDGDDKYCIACELNRHIPNLEKIEQREAWQKLEFAKHRLVYGLLRLNLPVQSKHDAPENGLAFDFISEKDAVPHNAQTMTGHSMGQVTINAAEASSAEREQRREDLSESYRTLIGHFRHEVGHYYWDQLIFPYPERLEECRRLFGDERADYAAALQKHYQSPLPNWRDNFVSVYASSHPWEDWAETWAHYFHIVDTMETAHQFGIQLHPQANKNASLAVAITINPFEHDDFSEIIEQHLPLTFAVNSLNRSMGQPDLYPFILVPAVRNKLSFIHRILRTYQRTQSGTDNSQS